MAVMRVKLEFDESHREVWKRLSYQGSATASKAPLMKRRIIRPVKSCAADWHIRSTPQRKMLIPVSLSAK